MPNWVKKFRILLWTALALFLLWLIVKAIVPSGQVTYNYDFTHPDDFVGQLTPGDRVMTPDQASQKIIGNPVYFSLRTTRPFDKAKLIITYRNSSDLPNIEAGVLVDNKLWRYDLQPISNSLLDQTIKSGAWGVLENDNALLLQKEEKYNSIKEFLANKPAKNEVALYNYNLPDSFKLDNYQATSTPFVWPYSIKGNYQFYVYVKNETLEVEFNFSDLNENKDPDPVLITLYDLANKTIETKSLADDGGDGQKTDPRSIKLTKAGLAEGVYKIEVKAGSDIITDYLTARQSKIAFINRLWLVGNLTPLNLAASGGVVSFQTNNPASRQLAYVNSEPIDLSQTYRQITSTNDCGPACQIKLAKSDVVIAMDGVFSLSADNLLEPRWQKLGSRRQIPPGVKYILANYPRPKIVGDWDQAEISLDLTKAYRDKGKYSLMLSIPTLSSEDTINDFVEIKNIRVELEGKNWRAMLRKLLGR